MDLIFGVHFQSIAFGSKHLNCESIDKYRDFSFIYFISNQTNPSHVYSHVVYVINFMAHQNCVNFHYKSDFISEVRISNGLR